MSAALTLRGLRKSYGANKALDGLDLEIPRGVICGLVGPNGAGKTTTYSIVGGMVRPDAGHVDILGDGPFDADRHRGRLSLLPQDCELSPTTPVTDLLVFYARLQGMESSAAKQEAARVLAQVDLADRGNQKIKQLSHGMRRRVAVAQALLGQPELVLMDEPTSGLDPHQVVRLRDIFRAQAGRSTLIISSHVLAELEACCDWVAFVEKGRVVKAGPMRELTGQSAMVRILVEGPVPLDRIREALPEAQVAFKDGELVVSGPRGADVAELNRRVLPILLDSGTRVLELRRGRSLEASYMQSREKLQ